MFLNWGTKKVLVYIWEEEKRGQGIVWEDWGARPKVTRGVRKRNWSCLCSNALVKSDSSDIWRLMASLFMHRWLLGLHIHLQPSRDKLLSAKKIWTLATAVLQWEHEVQSKYAFSSLQLMYTQRWHTHKQGFNSCIVIVCFFFPNHWLTLCTSQEITLTKQQHNKAWRVKASIYLYVVQVECALISARQKAHKNRGKNWIEEVLLLVYSHEDICTYTIGISMQFGTWHIPVLQFMQRMSFAVIVYCMHYKSTFQNNPFKTCTMSFQYTNYMDALFKVINAKQASCSWNTKADMRVHPTCIISGTEIKQYCWPPTDAVAYAINTSVLVNLLEHEVGMYQIRPLLWMVSL